MKNYFLLRDLFKFHGGFQAKNQQIVGFEHFLMTAQNQTLRHATARIFGIFNAESFIKQCSYLSFMKFTLYHANK
jgi:hypothetical protein